MAIGISRSRFRRRRSRRELVAGRASDVLGRAYWRATCWYGRQLRSALPPNAVRWSAIAGGAGVTAALASAMRRRRARPAATPASRERDR
jgi:hypothetical protein